MITDLVRHDAHAVSGSSAPTASSPSGARAPSTAALALTPTRSIADVDETCSRFRDDSDLSRVNREPGRWVEVRPAAGGRGRRGGRRAPGRPTAWSTRCSAARWSASATTATSAGSATIDVRREPRAPAPRTPTPGGRSAATDDRRPHPGRHRPRPRRHGKAWAADLVATAIERGARRARRWSASAGTSGSPRRTAGPGGSRSPSSRRRAARPSAWST